MANTDPEVAIIGAGALGSCTARELASDHDVLLLEKGEVARGAGGHAAGIISDWWFYIGENPVTEADEIMHDHMEDFDGTGQFEYTGCPFIRYLESEEDREEWQQRTDELNVDYINYYSNEEIEENWPDTLELTNKYGAIVDERAGYCDPRVYVRTLAEDAKDRGAEIRTQTEVTDIQTDSGEVTGVEVDGEETITTSNVIVVASAATREIVSNWIDIPTKSFTYSNLRFRINADLPDNLPMSGPGLFWWRPEVGNSIVTSGGEYWVERLNPPREPPHEHLEEVKELVAQEMAGVDSEQIEYMSGSGHVCPDGTTITRDALPIIDELDDPNGLIIADGLHGGVSLASAYATALRSLMTDEECPFSLEQFQADRFEDTSLDFDFDWIREWPTP